MQPFRETVLVTRLKTFLVVLLSLQNQAFAGDAIPKNEQHSCQQSFMPSLHIDNILYTTRIDLPSVLQIEEESFDDPWNEDEFIRCLQHPKIMNIVAKVGDTIVGFMIYELLEDRLHLLNLGVKTEFRRKGVGKILIKFLENKLSNGRRKKVVLEVIETDLSAQLFFKKMGFRSIKVLHNFFKDSERDAYRMQFLYNSSQP